MTATAAHKHAWKQTAHLDGCHYYTNVYACTGCRATAQKTIERSPIADPYSMIWMEPTTVEIRRDARGRFTKPHYEEKICDRCIELQDGAPVRASIVIVAADGTIEREEHHEDDQDDQ